MLMVKICGLRELDHARAAVEDGADFIGFIFAPSRRQIDPGRAAAIIAQLPRTAGRVGVFVNAKPELIDEAADRCRLDYVQLSGDESPELCSQIRLVPVIKAFRLQPYLHNVESSDLAGRQLLIQDAGPSSSHRRQFHGDGGPHGSVHPADRLLHANSGESLDSRGQELIALLACYRNVARIFVLDGASPGSFGGSGQLCDWDLAALAAREYPIMLAGGLTAQNVGEAIARVRPWGVDVSSGVEIGGTKDVGEIVRFIRAARGEHYDR